MQASATPHTRVSFCSFVCFLSVLLALGPCLSEILDLLFLGLPAPRASVLLGFFVAREGGSGWGSVTLRPQPLSPSAEGQSASGQG